MGVTVVGDLKDLPILHQDIITSLAKARYEDDRVAVPEMNSQGLLPWGLHGIYIRKCYTRLEEEVMPSWRNGRCCVVTGTPGIGKSTLLYYLLWKFMHGGLEGYETVVYGDGMCIFYMQRDRAAEQCQIHMFNAKQRLKGCSLGLIDAPANCQLGGLTLNNQNIVAALCVNHLLIAASAGLLDNYSDLRKATRQRLVLPAWQPEALCLWCCRCGLSAREWDARVQLCGDTVPRLVLADQEEGVWKSSFDSMLTAFTRALLGVTVQGLETAPRDAHTMLILQPSAELAEDPGEQQVEHEAGEVLCYVSAYVQREVHNALLRSSRLSEFLIAIPQAAPFAFEELVLQQLTNDGLEVEGGTLKLNEECWLEDLLEAGSEPQLGNLYRPRSRHFPSIDAYAVLMMGAVRTLYFIQITTAATHSRVQLRHVKDLPWANAKSIVCLYVFPGPSNLTLEDGENPMRAGAALGSAKCREETIQSEAVLAQLPGNVRAVIQRKGGYAGVAKRPAAASAGRPAKKAVT